MTFLQQASCGNRLRQKINRKRADASRRGKLGVEARRIKIQRDGPTWTVLREIEIRDPRTGNVNYWVVSGTGDPTAPLGLCISGTWNKLTSDRTLRGILAAQIWRLK